MVKKKWTTFGMGALLLLVAGCPVGDDDNSTSDMPPVVAIDDVATTTVGTPVSIAVLSNDLQDDDLITSAQDNATDANGDIRGTVEFDFFSFPEELIYTPPAGFEGVVTFTYTITGLGVEYDFTSVDTGTVTVTVTAIPVDDGMGPDDTEPGGDPSDETDPPVVITSATGCPEYVAYYNSLECVAIPLEESNTCSESIAEFCTGQLEFNTCRIENTLCVTDGTLFEDDEACIGILVCE